MAESSLRARAHQARLGRWCTSPHDVALRQGAPVTVERTFVGLPSPVVGRAGAGGHPCQGIYHAPPAAARRRRSSPPTTTSTSPSTTSASYLAERGYGFLGWNTRFRGAEAYFLLDHALAEIAVGVRWLREQGIERVVLLGNSGGGSLMGAYHSQSVEPNIRPARDRTVLAGRARPAAVRPVRVRRRPPRPARRPHRLDGRVGRRRERPAVARPVARPVRPRPAVRRRVRRRATAPPSATATPASPPGATPSSTASPPPGTSAATGCSR